MLQANLNRDELNRNVSVKPGDEFRLRELLQSFRAGNARHAGEGSPLTLHGLEGTAREPWMLSRGLKEPLGAHNGMESHIHWAGVLTLRRLSIQRNFGDLSTIGPHT